MGAQNSAGESRNKDFLVELKDNYHLEKEICDRRFGPSLLYKSKRSPQNMVLGVTKLLNSETQLADFQREMTVRRQHDHKSLLRLKGFKKDSGEGFCGSSNKFIIFLEYYDHDLGLEIERRSIHKEYLTESEVWYLCDAIISVSAYLEENEIYHGDIRPCNILLSEEGFAKLFDHGVVNDLRSGYIKMLAGSDRCYLTPDLLLAFAKREFQPTYNVHKADVFSFGMTLLYATTLTDPFYCYDFLAYKIVKKNMDELLNRTNSRYSVLLTDFIRTMLEEDEKNRPTFRELYSMLIPHQESIRQMQSMLENKENSRSLIQSNSRLFVSEPNSVLSNVIPTMQSQQAGPFLMSSPARQIVPQNLMPPQIFHQQYIIKDQAETSMGKMPEPIQNQLIQSSFFNDSLINRSVPSDNRSRVNYVQVIPSQIMFSNGYEIGHPVNSSLNMVNMGEYNNMHSMGLPAAPVGFGMQENFFLKNNENFGSSGRGLETPIEHLEIQKMKENPFELTADRSKSGMSTEASISANAILKENNFSVNQNQSVQHPYGILNFNEKSEIDRKVLEAIRNTEDTISRNAKIPSSRF